jgi:hypothetical protein
MTDAFRHPQHPQPPMTITDDILGLNLDFYRIVNARDVAGMALLWAHRLPLSCTHPGWDILSDRETIIASWRAILTGDAPPAILCFDERAQLYGDVAVVTCEEQIGDAAIAATNIFAQEDGTWRMVGHHGGIIHIRRQRFSHTAGHA